MESEHRWLRKIQPSAAGVDERKGDTSQGMQVVPRTQKRARKAGSRISPTRVTWSYEPRN